MNDNTMQKLRYTQNHELARWLLNELPAMRLRLGYISQAIEAPAGSTPTGTDTPGAVEAGRDIVGNQSAEVKA